MDTPLATPPQTPNSNKMHVLRIVILAIVLLALLAAASWFALPMIKERQVIQEGEKRKAILEELSSRNTNTEELTFEERQQILEQVSGGE
jgi:hypothetical protein